MTMLGSVLEILIELLGGVLVITVWIKKGKEKKKKHLFFDSLN